MSQLLQTSHGTIPQSTKEVIRPRTGKAITGEILLPREIVATVSPVSYATTKRILKKACLNKQIICDVPALFWNWITLRDGTFAVIIEDERTAIRYQWTVCPRTFAPVNLGPIDA